MPWNRDPARIIDEMIETVEEVQREAVFSLFSDIIQSTPVAEEGGGRLRSNWFLSGKTPSTKITGIRSEGQALGDLAAIFAMNADTFTLANNLPYAAKAEFGGFGYDPSSGKTTPDGYSTQAPYGMVRTNVVRWSQIVNEEARNRGR